MLARSDLLRTAANVFLTPVDLTRLPGREAWRPFGRLRVAPTTTARDTPSGAEGRRALVVGSREPASIAAVVDALREASPGITVDLPGESGKPAPGLWRVRRQRYDLACLVLTGEGLRREKLIGVLSGAGAVLACNRSGQWYRVQGPPCRPLSARWWARLTLAGLLSAQYLRITMWLRVWDLIWRIFPIPPPVPDPGPATAQATTAHFTAPDLLPAPCAGMKCARAGPPLPAGCFITPPQAGHETACTFIVPAHNQRHLMDLCLPPLLEEAGRAHQVVLVDDGSTDGTAEYVQRQYPRVQVVRLARNLGFAGAVRAGIAASRTPLFALVNSDVQVRPGFLRAMLPHFDRDDTFAVCARIELPDGSQIETGNVAVAFSGILEPYHVPPVRPGPILYAGGASSIFHRSRYDALGGFDTGYRPFYWEDIDLGYRAWRRGWRSLFEPSASVRHQRRAAIGPRFGSRYADETFLANALVFTWKNVRDPAMLSQHWVYVCARLYREVLAGEGRMCRALLRALPRLPQALAKRWRERRRGDLGDGDILALATPADTNPQVDRSKLLSNAKGILP